MAVSVKAGVRFEDGAPQALFDVGNQTRSR